MNGLKLKSLENHNCIGFDVDHCLVRYKLKALTKLCYESLMKSLIQSKDYPQSLLDLTDEELGIGMNYLVIDTDNGTILKLGENGYILKGKRGFKDIDVVKEYGEERKLQEFDPISVRRDSRYAVNSTNFENAIPVVFAKIYEMKMQLKKLEIDEKVNNCNEKSTEDSSDDLANEKIINKDSNEKINSKDGNESIISKDGHENIIKKDGNENIITKDGNENVITKDGNENIITKDGDENIINKDANDSEILSVSDCRAIMSDIVWSLKTNYAHYTEQEVFPMLECGEFFKAIVGDIDNIIYKQDAFKEVLKTLRQQHKFLFISTNSHYEFMNLTMSYAYGDDWEDLFDAVFVKAGKPVFFTNYYAPMFPLDLTSINHKGPQTSEISPQNKIYVEGNYDILTKYLVSKGITGRIMFIGDNILTDCFFSQHIPTQNWDAIAIVEELFETLDANDPVHKQAMDTFPAYNSQWGDYLSESVNGKIIFNFWYGLALKDLLGGVIRLLDCPQTEKLWHFQQ